MTKKEVEELQEKWKKTGDPPCDHPELELVRTDEGYLTGDLHCKNCGVWHET